MAFLFLRQSFCSVSISALLVLLEPLKLHQRVAHTSIQDFSHVYSWVVAFFAFMCASAW